MNYQNIFSKYLELANFNSVDFLEFYEDLTQMRETKQQLAENKDFRKMFYECLNNFCLSNGLFYRLNQSYLTDEQKTFIGLISLNGYQPKNRYRQAILNYYFKNIDKPISEIALENILQDKDFSKNYYSDIPAIMIGLEKQTVQYPILKNCELQNHINEFINIGITMQFDVDGFPKNEFLYLLWGICIYDVYNTKHETFKDLINHIKAYVQLNLLSKCFDGRFCGNDFNLITFIDVKNNGILQKNFRYQCAKKYKLVEHEAKTKLIDDDKGLYILTKYTNEELLNNWEQMEELFKNKDYNKLINKWFDSQCLTRSTCLIGCILISVLSGKLIKFKRDEMPDWKSIIEGSFKETFELRGSAENGDLNNLSEMSNLKIITLGDVLKTLSSYVNIFM